MKCSLCDNRKLLTIPINIDNGRFIKQEQVCMDCFVTEYIQRPRVLVRDDGKTKTTQEEDQTGK